MLLAQSEKPPIHARRGRVRPDREELWNNEVTAREPKVFAPGEQEGRVVSIVPSTGFRHNAGMDSAVTEPSVHHLTELGRQLSSSGDLCAAELWGRVLEQEPLNCEAYANLGILAARTGDREKALHMARRAEGLNPSTMELLEIARLYVVLGEYRTALDRYAQAERLGQELPASTCAEIAVCHFELGGALEGCKWLRKGRRQSPKSRCIQEAWESYGDRCGDAEAAEAQEG